MDERPDFRDFKYRNRSSNVVKTSDGRFFAFENSKPLRAACAVMRYAYIFVPFVNMITLFRFWPNLIFDAYFVALILVIVSEHIRYRTASFALVREDTEDYAIAAEMKFPKPAGKVLTFCFRGISVFVMLFLLANSFCATWVRSIIENKGYIVSEIVTFYSDFYVRKDGIYKDGGIYILPVETYSEPQLAVEVKVNKSPGVIHFTLDGKPIKGHIYKNFYRLWFWQEEYFQQTYSAYIYDISDIRDGSVLEMSCGSLYKRWVFHLAEVDEG